MIPRLISWTPPTNSTASRTKSVTVVLTTPSSASRPTVKAVTPASAAVIRPISVAMLSGTSE
jgi:hypothetical protein